MEMVLNKGFQKLEIQEMESIEGGSFGAIVAGAFAGTAIAHVVGCGVKGAIAGTAVAPGIGTAIGAVSGIVVGGIVGTAVSALYDSF